MGKKPLSAFAAYNGGLTVAAASGGRVLKKKKKAKSKKLGPEDYEKIQEEIKLAKLFENPNKKKAKKKKMQKKGNTASSMNGSESRREEEPMDFNKTLQRAFGIVEKNEKGKKVESNNSSSPSKKGKQLKAKKNKSKVDADGSIEDGKKAFAWMISPLDADQFFEETFEERPLHVKRGDPAYYKSVFSTKAFDEILREKHVVFQKNLDVTSFTNDKRETLTPEGGRAYPSVAWDFYNNGCSLRMLNPQTFSEPLWKLCARLQEFLGSMVGANMYLTPPGTQGFAPHYDDVEVFILQIEGKKHWRVYEPRTSQEKLPRFSSPNFSQLEIGEPCMDIILEAGDLLYMPRGTIHQGDCLKDFHSLHVTISCHQLNTYGDFLLKILPAALENAMREDVEFRKGLPIDYFRYMGVVNSDKEADPKRGNFLKTVENLIGKLFTHAPIDEGVDQMAKVYLHSTLPPYLNDPEETARCVEAGGEKWSVSKNRVVNRVEIDPDTEVRLLRANCLRIVTEGENNEDDDDDDEDTVKIYYNVENTREYQEVEPQFIEVDAELAPAVEFLYNSYPEYVRVEELPLEDLSDKMNLVQKLWESKLLMTKTKLSSHYDD